VRRKRADPEAIERAKRHAEQARVDAGLPAVDPEDEAAEARRQAPKVKLPKR
jgi:hypothetical protein